MNEQARAGRPPLPPGERAESQIQLRVKRARKAAYVKFAQRQKKTLAQAIFDEMDRASGYKE